MKSGFLIKDLRTYSNLSITLVSFQNHSSILKGFFFKKSQKGAPQGAGNDSVWSVGILTTTCPQIIVESAEVIRHSPQLWKGVVKEKHDLW